MNSAQDRSTVHSRLLAKLALSLGTLLVLFLAGELDDMELRDDRDPMHSTSHGHGVVAGRSADPLTR